MLYAIYPLCFVYTVEDLQRRPSHFESVPAYNTHAAHPRAE